MKIGEIFTNLINSLNNGKTGFSGRKLSALFIMVLVGYCHVKYVTEKEVTTVIMYDLIFILLALSIVTAEQVIKFKSDSKKDEEPK